MQINTIIMEVKFLNKHSCSRHPINGGRLDNQKIGSCRQCFLVEPLKFSQLPIQSSSSSSSLSTRTSTEAPQTPFQLQCPDQHHPSIYIGSNTHTHTRSIGVSSLQRLTTKLFETLSCSLMEEQCL